MLSSVPRTPARKIAQSVPRFAPKLASQRQQRAIHALTARTTVPRLASTLSTRFLDSRVLGQKCRALNHAARTCLGWATSTTPHSTASDPAEAAAVEYLEQGTQKLEEGDVQAAKELYQRSVEIKRNAGSLFNLGVTHYHLKEFDEAIAAWKESIELQPSSADAHTNLANAYIISPVARPDLALRHLQIAHSLAPEDAEIAFNLAAVLEACGRLEDALTYYKLSKDNGVDRAEMHMRNVSAKILGQRMKQAEAAAAEGADKTQS